MNLNNKVALITGGTKGIGAQTALELARRGADVALAARNIDDDAQSLQKSIEAMGRKCVLITANLAEGADATRCVAETIDKLGHLDVLVHSAGGPAPGSLLSITEEQWRSAFDIHVHAIFYLCRAAVPEMQKRGEGAIMLISSAAGLRGCLGAAAYGVVKGSLIQFTRVLAREFADFNIRVNCVTPGVIRTRFQSGLTPEQVKNNLDNRIPLHREGKPEDVANMIAALVENDFITGESVTIDGGMSMRIV